MVGLFGIVFILSSCGGASNTICDSAVDPSSGGFQAGTGTESDPYIICTAEQLNLIGADGALDLKSYRLEADIDLSGVTFNIIGTSGISWFMSGSLGLDEVGFRGVFDGNNKKISNLVVEHATVTGIPVGFISAVGVGGVVKNLGLENISVTAGVELVGGLVGLNIGTITSCYTTGVVNANSSAGGLVGANVNGESMCGSPVIPNIGSIENSYSVCDVTSTVSEAIGGLVGANKGAIAKSYATGNVSGGASSSQGNGVGGLVGQNKETGTIINSYATTGTVRGNFFVGGLVGSNSNLIMDSYSTGNVSGITPLGIGGLVGKNSITPEGVAFRCFWDTETSEQAASAAGTGKNTVQMKSQVTFAGWNFTTVWGIVDTDTEQSYPYLIL